MKLPEAQPVHANDSAPVPQDGRGRSQPILAVLLLGATLLGAAFAIWSILGFHGVPYNAYKMFSEQQRHLAIVAFCAMLLWTGFGTSFIASLIVTRPRVGLALPLLVIGASLVSFALLRWSVRVASIDKVLGACVLGWPLDSERLGRFLALYGGSGLLLAVGSAVCGTIKARGLWPGTRLGLLLLLWCAPWLWLARHIVIDLASTDNLTELMNLDHHGELPLMGLALLISLNAAAVAHELRRPRLTRLLAVAMATLAAAGLGWFLLRLGLLDSLVKYDTTFPAVQFLLGPDRKQLLPMTELFGRWTAVQLGAVLILAAGQLGHLLFLRPYGSDSPKTAPLATDAPWPRLTYLVLTLCYLTFVIYGSLVPLKFKCVPFDDAWSHFRHIPYLALGLGSRADLVANLLLMIPLAFLAMGAITSAKRGPWRPVAAVGVFITCGMLAAAIEFAQIYFPPRTVSLNDILAETAGSAIGVVCWFLWGGRVTAWVATVLRARGEGRLAVTILRGYLVFLVLYQLLPFDATIRPSELYQRIRGGRVTLIPFHDADLFSTYAVMSKIAVMVPVGFVFYLAGRKRSLWRATFQAAAFAFAIEFFQVFIVSRVASTTDVILGSIGGLIGAQLAASVGPTSPRPWIHRPFWLRNGRWIKLAATLAGLAALAWYNWQPFDFSWPPEGLWAHTAVIQAPFFNQYHMSEFLAAAQIARVATVAFILGLLLKSQSSDRSYLGPAVLVVITAATLEGVRMFMPPQHAPDVIRACLFIVAGLLAVRCHCVFARTFLATSPTSAPDFLNACQCDRLDRMTQITQTDQPGGNAADKPVDLPPSNGGHAN